MNTGSLQSYDENQIDTVPRVCRECRRLFYMRPWRYTCVQCRGWPHVGLTMKYVTVP